MINLEKTEMLLQSDDNLLKERRSQYIEKLVASDPAIHKQFVFDEQELITIDDEASDPLREDEFMPVRGLVHKYKNRALLLLTAQCATYCRFCTRKRMVSHVEKGRIRKDDVDEWKAYLTAHPEIRDAIMSGGDPLFVSTELFAYVIDTLSSIESLKVVRLGTRVPITDPVLVTDQKIEILRRLRQPLYVGLNFEHPKEITPEVREAVKKLQTAGGICYSQSVFLKDVNDDYDVLFELFTELFEMGVRPYYIYRCDPVEGVSHFRADINKEREIMTKLRSTLSGLACPTYVIDTPYGAGKIPVPLDFWDCWGDTYRDFEGKEHKVI